MCKKKALKNVLVQRLPFYFDDRVLQIESKSPNIILLYNHSYLRGDEKPKRYLMTNLQMLQKYLELKLY
jgi:hypothetical protein